MKDTLILPDQILQFVTRSSHQSLFEAYGFPTMLTVIAGIAIIIANQRLARSARSDSQRANRLTLYLAWVSELRRATAVFMTTSFQHVQDLKKAAYLKSAAASPQLIEQMKEGGLGIMEQAEKIRSDIRAVTMQEGEAADQLRLLLNPSDQLSIEINQIREQILAVTMRSSVSADDMIIEQNKLSVDLINKTLAYIRQRELEALEG